MLLGTPTGVSLDAFVPNFHTKWTSAVEVAREGLAEQGLKSLGDKSLDHPPGRPLRPVETENEWGRREAMSASYGLLIPHELPLCVETEEA